MNSLRLGILGSGKGSNCRAILEEIRRGRLAAEVQLVVADRPEAGIVDVAREFGVQSAVLAEGPWRTKLDSAAETELVRLLRTAEVELVVLAGFMRVLKAPVLDAFPEDHQYSSLIAAEISGEGSVGAGARSR